MNILQTVAVSAATAVATLMAANFVLRADATAPPAPTDIISAKGMIAAFQDRCPPMYGEWKPYALANGRVLIGAGQGSEYGVRGHALDSGGKPTEKPTGNQLLPRVAGYVGGREEVLLALENIPNHAHIGGGSAKVWAQNFDPNNGFGLQGGPGQMIQGDVSFSVGNVQNYPSTGEKPVTVMPPWLAVVYCVHT